MVFNELVCKMSSNSKQKIPKQHNINALKSLRLPLPTKPFTYKYINSFIIARLQKKPRKSFENPLVGSRVSGLGSHLSDGVCLPDKMISLLHFSVFLKFGACYIWISGASSE